MKPFELEPSLYPLILYTRKFATLISAGISLMRCFELLEATTDDPAMRAANAHLREKVGGGETLSAAMKELPEVFSPFYIAFVRAGEIGGVLDLTLADLADWLDQELAAGQRFRTLGLLLKTYAKVNRTAFGLGAERQAREALKKSRGRARVASFCRLFEHCLTAGVPLKLSLATAADVLDEAAAEQIHLAAEGLQADDKLAPVLLKIEELGPVVAQMVAIGEETDSLDAALRSAAEFIEAEVADILHRAVPLPG